MSINLLQRLLIFFVGIPIVIVFVILLPNYNHLALNIFITIVSSVGAVEFALMLKAKGFPVYVPEAAILGSLSPLAATFIASFGTNSEITQSLFIIGASWVLVSEIFFHQFRGVNSTKRTKTNKDILPDYSLVLSRLSAAFSVMIYPGLLLSWVITMSALEFSSIVILTYAFTVIANDSTAWGTGMLFGRNNRGMFAVSPNKSVAGYLGGLTASMGVCTAMACMFPNAFPADQIPQLPSAILLGFFSGIAVILGDLAESAIKRGSGVKDSGWLIPGRGGVLDSTDSFALTAPVFYVLYRFFF